MIQELPQHGVIPTGVTKGAGTMAVGNCALFLFSPRDIVSHYKRPLIYNFNNEMMNAISENIVNKPDISHSVRRTLALPSMTQSIVPSPQNGIPVNTASYSDNWMFVLIIDEDGRDRMMISNKLLTRTILIGMCAAEPISQSGMMSMTPEQFLNPNCQLIVTKNLQMTKYGTLNANGIGNKIQTIVNDNIVQFDNNIWGNNGGMVGGLDNTYYHTLMPTDVHNASEIGGGQITSVIQTDHAINFSGPTKIAGNLESPRHHLKDILTSFETGVSNINYSGRVGGFSETVDSFDLEHNDLKTYVGLAIDESRHVHNASSNQATIGDVTTIFLTIGMVVANYHPKVFPIVTPKNAGIDIMPQNYMTISNVYSSLVCAVLPTYLNTVGLSAIGFMFNSVHQVFELLHIEAMLNITQHELHLKWNEFKFLISNELFPVLFGNGGPFDMQVMSSVNGTTDVILNFLDHDPVPHGAIYQENAVLGGIVSPLVGTTEHLRYNSVQLNNLIQNVDAMYTRPTFY